MCIHAGGSVIARSRVGVSSSVGDILVSMPLGRHVESSHPATSVARERSIVAVFSADPDLPK